MRLGLAVGALLVGAVIPLAADARTVPPPPYRGVIEGFYGTPWSHAARVSMIRWIGRHGMNTYVYAPKEEAYHRALWREPYPAAHIAQFQRLVTVARASRVRFVYGISPGLSMCYSSPAERRALVTKLGQLAALGVVDFMLALDDIPVGFHCEADAAAFGPGLRGLGRAHASLGNYVRSSFPRARLSLVPTYYEIRATTPYLDALARALHRSVAIVWTGPEVVSARITVVDAQRAARVLRRPPLLWDNYPANDWARGDLHVGPVVGRGPGVPRQMAGFLANPMEEAESSKVALFTLARYLRSPATYRPRQVWRAALRELAGSRRAARLLERFADNSLSTSTLNEVDRIRDQDSPALWRLIFDVGRALRTRDARKALDRLDGELRLQVELAEHLPPLIRNKRFVGEIGPWLEKTRANALAGRAAVAAIRADLQPSREAVRRARATLDAAWANAYNQRKETHGTAIPFLVGMARARTTCDSTGGVVVRGRRPTRLSPGDRRVRSQIELRIARLARAVDRRNAREIARIYDPGYRSALGNTHAEIVGAWATVLRASNIERVRFRLEAFDPGDRLCGGPVVAAVPWTADGRLPQSVPFVEGGGGRQSMGERAVFLFANRGTAAKPDWRIVWATSASTNRF